MKKWREFEGVLMRRRVWRIVVWEREKEEREDSRVLDQVGLWVFMSWAMVLDVLVFVDLGFTFLTFLFGGSLLMVWE